MSLLLSTKAQVKPREEHRDRVRGIQATLSITRAFLGHSCSVTEVGELFQARDSCTKASEAGKPLGWFSKEHKGYG